MPYYVYILANGRRGTIYIGVTNDLAGFTNIALMPFLVSPGSIVSIDWCITKSMTTFAKRSRKRRE